jgi:tRNA dimethylallyltransferase
VYQKLVRLDPEYAKMVHPNNVQYVIRGIEVILISGKSKLATKRPKELQYDVLFLTPYERDCGKREWLYHRINYRVDLMFEQ